MANVFVTLTEVGINAVTADPAGNSVGTSDTGFIGKSDATTKVPFKARKLLLRLTSAGAGVVTVKAGDNPPSHGASYGDLTLTVGAATKWATVEAARYLQDDGTIQLTVSGAAVVVSALVLPDAL